MGLAGRHMPLGDTKKKSQPPQLATISAEKQAARLRGGTFLPNVALFVPFDPISALYG